MANSGDAGAEGVGGALLEALDKGGSGSRCRYNSQIVADEIS